MELFTQKKLRLGKWMALFWRAGMSKWGRAGRAVKVYSLDRLWFVSLFGSQKSSLSLASSSGRCNKRRLCDYGHPCQEAETRRATWSIRTRKAGGLGVGRKVGNADRQRLDGFVVGQTMESLGCQASKQSKELVLMLVLQHSHHHYRSIHISKFRQRLCSHRAQLV